MTLRLAIFDVDGTLSDSQGEIVAAMRAAFEGQSLTPPDRAAILSIVGLSLDQAVESLVPSLHPDRRSALADAYRSAYFQRRQSHGASPLYDGAKEALERLARDEHLLLGVATGKSRRGLDALIEEHGLGATFVTRQTSDFHPSKPHPAMIEAALAEAGVGPENAVMIGDTSFDMEMARAAGVRAIGVTWGYHPPGALALADHVVDTFDALTQRIEQLWDGAA